MADIDELEPWLHNKTYITKLPAEVPAGRFLVHNHVPPAQRIGSRGFRVWLQSDDVDPPLRACDCNWSDRPHYLHAGLADLAPNNSHNIERDERGDA